MRTPHPDPECLKRSHGTEAPLAWADGPAPQGGREAVRRIRALVFDFDGLLVDTEGPIFAAWQRIYRDRGQELRRDRGRSLLGASVGLFDQQMDYGSRGG